MTLKLKKTVFAVLLTGLIGCGAEEPSAAIAGNSEAVNESPAPVAQASERQQPAISGTASKVGDQMPAYTANDLKGGTWKLAEEKGITMLNLWATWCGPCRYEIPALIELQKEYGDQGLQVVGVSMDQPGMEPQIQSFVKNAGINYTIVHDPRAQLADVFETTIIPTTALIDHDGQVVWFHAGIVTKDDPKMLQALKSALAGKDGKPARAQS